VIFTSTTFFLFLVLVYGLYWGLKERRHQNILLVVASYTFYAWWDWRFCGLLLFSSLLDYWVALRMEKIPLRADRRPLILLSVFANLGLLGFFKYFNFFIENFYQFLNMLGWKADPVSLRIILPVGISFYTFQTMSYAIDVYRDKVKICRSLPDYLAYVSFFPQLVAGPIERAGNLLPQLSNDRNFDSVASRDGCRLILWGLFKKMVIADNLGTIVESFYGSPNSASGPGLAFATICFAFQIYCDFSGYSDIAIGVARLFGFRLMRNFAYPYFSQSLAEFWRRWHISLSSWFRDYVYIALGGSRVPYFRRIANLVFTFLLSGFWHGASWNFIVWGGMHGLGVIPGIGRKTKHKIHASVPPAQAGLVRKPYTIIKIGLTFIFVCIGWVFFRSGTMADAFLILEKIFLNIGNLNAYRELLGYVLSNAHTNTTVKLLLGFIIVEWLQRQHHHPLVLEKWPRVARWTVYTIVFWVIIYFGTETRGDFIYFQF